MKHDLPMKLQLENLTFTYPGSREPSLKEINLVIDPGERIVITGKEGRQIYVDAIDSRPVYASKWSHQLQRISSIQFEFDSLRSCIGDALMIEQIFHGSILDNITLDRSGIDFAEVHALAEATGLAEFVRNLPHGYNTILDPRAKSFHLELFPRSSCSEALQGKPSLLLIESIFDQWSSAEKTEFSILYFLSSLIILSWCYLMTC